MADHIAGKVIIVTGAGSGFGRLTAQKAAARGARLVCADVNEQAAEQTAVSIREAGGTAMAVAVDVTRIEDMRALVAKTLEALGVVDVLINNAGIMPLAFMADHAQAIDAWSRCIDINFRGVVNGAAAVYDAMMERGEGHIINISSIYGNHPVVGAAVYGATKAAVNYFSHAVRQEARGKIRVTLVKPTGVPTTGIGQTVVNTAGSVGIVGQNAADFRRLALQAMAGELAPEQGDPESIDYFSLQADEIADAVLYAIDQPLGVTVSDITVRATGEHYIL
ncbi:MAG TPA: SDR family oxidoreductase [Sphingobium sp.]